ncbi:MAG: hypothetical protein H7Z38_07500 [Rubrivivax sp.]|nr:hypothetical protein [Pyrinomonadaceae bacterium]
MKSQKTDSKLAICVDNSGYEMSLERRKVYPVLPDESAERSNFIRVVDETGEDYLFPTDRFVLITVTREVEEAVLAEA